MHKKRSFESKLTWLSLSVSVPLLLLLIVTMLYANISIYLTILTGFLGSIGVFVTNSLIHQKSAFQFRSLSNLLEAMLKGDYALRLRSDKPDSALDELVISINKLAEHLSQQRLMSVENQLLLNTVIEHIDVAILSVDENGLTHQLNPAAKKLISANNSKERKAVTEQIEILKNMAIGRSQVLQLSFAQHNGRFRVHCEEFRSSGLQHRLILITDIAHLLRMEEDKAWQNLVRVLSHEINNSLTPIASISQTLLKMSQSQQGFPPEDKDLSQGLKLISERSHDLQEFVNSYKKLNKLPAPNLQEFDITLIANKVANLFDQKKFKIISQESIALMIDAIQIEQVLINLVKNGIEASTDNQPPVTMSWLYTEDQCRILIVDCGTGVRNPENLFVPLYTTKPHGSGIGLALSRQIIESHNGQLTLSNRSDQQGCVAQIVLPI